MQWKLFLLAFILLESINGIGHTQILFEIVIDKTNYIIPTVLSENSQRQIICQPTLLILYSKIFFRSCKFLYYGIYFSSKLSCERRFFKQKKDFLRTNWQKNGNCLKIRYSLKFGRCFCCKYDLFRTFLYPYPPAGKLPYLRHCSIYEQVKHNKKVFTFSPHHLPLSGTARLFSRDFQCFTLSALEISIFRC